MKIRVINEFHDKFNLSVVFGKGEIHEFEDARAKEIIARGLGQRVEDTKVEEPVEAPAVEAKVETAEVKPKTRKPRKKVENDQ